ncbi:hypothetical protein A3K86_06725 [Photobacterium jeanii]|uniref:DUF3379 domain-containing protein n=1 Tax=Photobacterium jeanii TaxID=858640 RepID=A0A178KNM3_9GAMM|nr:DUF3379 domain-containing protein [Photobacterium jeanii]OAN18575.1 hypothetical protein A3K86_06725 [Photobacterium jeanii]PST91744.1 DUF3379 domain-containing protein [Photobacterium jeanii]
MDDLEFRRRILADPNDNSEEMIEAKNASLVNRKLSDELQLLDAKIDKALKVDVPDDLADRILFHQSGQTPAKPKTTKVHLAIAASVAFAFGIFTGQFNSIFDNTSSTSKTAQIAAAEANLGQMALDHFYAEAPFVNTIDEGVELSQVNAKLKPFGSELTELPGHVYYVNHCSFGNQNALHMVMDTPQGKVTVFVVPMKSQIETDFKDSKMEGVLMPLRDASLIVVGEKGSDMKPVANTIKSELRWQI